MPESRPVGRSGVPAVAQHDRFGVCSVIAALDEALLEVERDPRTVLWGSFWDRLTDGHYIPYRPEADDA